MPTVLCLTNSRDARTQLAVRQHVENLGAMFHIERVDNFSNSYSFSLEANGKIKSRFGNFIAATHKKLSVWHRRVEFMNSPTFFKCTENLFGDSNSRNFFHSEYNLLVINFHRLLSSAYWINPPRAYLAAQGKLRNLEMAASLGMQIPPTILSNICDEIISFSTKYSPQILIKPLDSFEIKEHGTLSHCVARKISLSDVILNSNSIGVAPVFLQKYIEKEFELRVIVIGEKVFSVAIYSQEHDKAKEDWRCAPLNELRYETFDLPDKIQQQLIEFLKAFELRFGVFDLIVAKDGGIYFLECNPDGEWFWLEMATDLQISRALAEDLVENAMAIH